MILRPHPDYWGMQKGRAELSQQSENRQLLCYPSNYFKILAFCISRQACQAQRSSFYFKSPDAPKEILWKRRLSLSYQQQCCDNEGRTVHKHHEPCVFLLPVRATASSTATIHMWSSARLCLLTDCSCNSSMTECKNLPTEYKELLSKEREMWNWRDWAFF